MVAPVVIGAAISGAASLLGGGSSNSKGYDFQREMAQHGVRYRVEDAKRAGVHPLYALGAQLPGGIPMDSGRSREEAIAEAGQAIGSGIAARGTRQERLLAAYSIEAAKKQLQEADARIELYNSEAALARHQAIASKPFPSSGDGMVSGQVVPESEAVEKLRGMVSVEPSIVQSVSGADSGIQAGTPAGMREFNLPGGFRVLLPSEQSGSMSEAVEAVSESILTQYGVLAENVRHYGWNWFFDFLDRYVVPGRWLSGRDAQGWGSRVYDAVQRAGRRSHESWPSIPTLR